jgi:hypothetical protein
MCLGDSLAFSLCALGLSGGTLALLRSAVGTQEG